MLSCGHAREGSPRASSFEQHQQRKGKRGKTRGPGGKSWPKGRLSEREVKSQSSRAFRSKPRARIDCDRPPGVRRGGERASERARERESERARERESERALDRGAARACLGGGGGDGHGLGRIPARASESRRARRGTPESRRSSGSPEPGGHAHRHIVPPGSLANRANRARFRGARNRRGRGARRRGRAEARLGGHRRRPKPSDGTKPLSYNPQPHALSFSLFLGFCLSLDAGRAGRGPGAAIPSDRPPSMVAREPYLVVDALGCPRSRAGR